MRDGTVTVQRDGTVLVQCWTSGFDFPISSMPIAKLERTVTPPTKAHKLALKG